MKQKPSLREKLALWIALLSIAFISTSPVILVYMWLYAWREGLYPKAGWAERIVGPGATTTIHGPWSYDLVLTSAWDYALFMPIYSFIFALVSLIIKPNIRASVVLGLSIICFFLVLFHVGLVED